jgi:hypothetical protein
MEENKYQNGKIYKVIDNNHNLIYYGSTINKLCKRIATHREAYRKKKAYYTIFEIFDKYGLENCKIELVENFPCNNRKELDAREGFYIKNNECVNKFVAGRSKEYYKEYQKEYQKKLYEKKKDLIKIKNEKYREKNKDLIKNKRDANKEKMNLYQKLYRKAKKEKSEIYLIN